LPAAAADGAAAATLTPDVVHAGTAWIRRARAAAGLSTEDYAVVVEGTTPADDPEAARGVTEAWRAAGATWWIEADWSVPADDVRAYAEQRLAAGPPR
ncbi:MAG TPA: hypothetical protein VNV66_07070, partial [Pilimelia sp.]|nr:hypothetical protein [Pilimelia sp.]